MSYYVSTDGGLITCSLITGKIQRLRNLLLDLVRSTPRQQSEPDASHCQSPTKNRSFRPRVIFILSHRAAFLNFLATWLSVDPLLSNLSRVRAPIDYLDFDGELLDEISGGSLGVEGDPQWLEYVNAWPAGTRGPLIVLLHARSPPLSVAALRAGPDTRVVICDAEWRKDVLELVKSK